MPSPLGVDDMTVLKAAFVNDAITLTRDKDFPKLILHDRHPAHGLILLKYQGAGPWAVYSAEIVETIVRLDEGLRGAVTVIHPNGYEQMRF